MIFSPTVLIINLGPPDWWHQTALRKSNDDICCIVRFRRGPIPNLSFWQRLKRSMKACFHGDWCWMTENRIEDPFKGINNIIKSWTHAFMVVDLSIFHGISWNLVRWSNFWILIQKIWTSGPKFSEKSGKIVENREKWPKISKNRQNSGFLRVTPCKPGNWWFESSILRGIFAIFAKNRLFRGNFFRKSRKSGKSLKIGENLRFWPFLGIFGHFWPFSVIFGENSSKLTDRAICSIRRAYYCLKALASVLHSCRQT